MKSMSVSRAARAALGLLALAAVLVLAGCAETDVVAKVAKESFGAFAKALPAAPAFDAAGGVRTFASPAGDRFELAADFSGAADATISVDAAPFLAAGLDPAKLAGPAGVAYAVEGGRLVIRHELGSAALGAKAKGSTDEHFAAFVAAYRAAVGYHEALDHYGIALGGGNMFEWAKDIVKNDKDLVFVLDPVALAAAGLDPAKVEGWVFAKVPVMDAAGKKIEVEKLLRPFDLK